MAVDFTEKAKRYQAIDQIIASGRKLKWNQIISELRNEYNIETSKSSFFRDIEELQEKYQAPIDTDFETNGYFYTDPKYRLPRFYTDENAAKAARLIKTLMDRVKGNPLYKEAQEVFESLATESRDLSIENIRIKNKPDNDRIIFVGAPNKDIPAETWRLLDKALQENLVITFDYQSLTDKKPSKRRVQPWQLIYDNGNWNLHALDVIKNGRRRYSLSEMKNIQLTKEVFRLPKDYDFRKMTMGSFGCMCHDQKLDYKIHLHGYAARISKNRVWGEGQTIVPDKKNPGPDGDGIILSFTSNQLFSIRRWVWQWAGEAFPIAPKELVDDWLERRKAVNALTPART
ncbi:MAG: WYL domain-containing protein [Treponema sp.]|nr:WYL domain-containing protein [Treponema sp.]